MATPTPIRTPTGHPDDNLDILPPPGQMSNNDLVAWIKRRSYSSSPLYAEDFSRFRKSELYDQGDQWVQRARSTSDAASASQWKKVSVVDVHGHSIPIPVYNEGVLLRENESARLGRPEYKPRVRPSGHNPGIKEKEGAKGAERALQSRVEEMWSDEEDKLHLHIPLYGGAWLKSYWDQTWLETVRVPAEALACPLNPKTQSPSSPSSPSSSPSQPSGPPPLAGLNLEGAGLGADSSLTPQQTPLGDSPLPAGGAPSMAAPTPPPGMGPGAGMGMGMGMEMEAGMGLPPAAPETCTYVCRKEEHPEPGASCPIHALPLVPYKPTMDEALNANLGKDVPKGDWYLKVCFPYQVYPRDAGIGVNPTDVDEWLEVYTEPIAWAEERWPDKIRDPKTGHLRVHPQNPATLMAENPTLGSPDVLEKVATAGVFRSHVAIYEYHRKPWMAWDPTTKGYSKNRGRSIFVVTGAGGNGVVCFDDHMMIESLNKPGTFVARANLQYVPWGKRDGGRRATVGQSLWDRLFDPQDGINERASQTRAVNQRGAMPWYLQKAGINLETRSADAAVPFRRVVADIDPNDKQLPLTLLNNEVINPGVYQEIEFNSQFMRKNQVEVEAGQVPPGVAAATAIAYLKTEAGEKRRPCILRIRRSLARAWKHGAELMSALYIEPRPYSYEDENGDERQAFISGDIIAEANPKVDIYPTPDYDITDARRESIRDMVTLGILDPKATPQLSRKIVQAMDESLDFFLDDDHQEQQAQREWRDFQENGRIPVTDPSLDDDQTHYQEHGRACFSEWFREKEDEGMWDEALQVLSGDWEEVMDGIIGILLQPPMPPPPGAENKKPAPKPSIQSMLIFAWATKLQQAGFPGPDPASGTDPATQQPLPLPEALTKVVIPWRAHMEAHRLKVQLKQKKEEMKAMMAAAPPPPGEGGAPGKGSAPVSTEEQQGQGGNEAPGQGSAPQPGPGPGQGPVA